MVPRKRYPAFLQSLEGAAPDGGVLVTDLPSAEIDRGRAGRVLHLDHRYFNPEPPAGAIRMPYFMHPAAYREGLHEIPSPPVAARRPVRLVFLGTHAHEFYTRNFRFPILPRPAILDRFLDRFAGRISHLEGADLPPGSIPILVRIDRSGGDSDSKTFLPRRDYFGVLARSDFFLSPPGWCMPFSHNLVEGMAMGSIPLLNYAGYLEPPLRAGIDCIGFESAAGLEGAVERILAMPEAEVARMRAGVLAYYDEQLRPGRWLRRALRRPERDVTVLVNNEEVSVGLEGW